jgi:diphthamide synthase subunit DPH2
VLHRLEDKLRAAGKEFFTLLLSEITPAKVRGQRSEDVVAV